MQDRLAIIRAGIESIENVRITGDFVEEVGLIRGDITVEHMSACLTFDVTIYNPYPFQFHNTETIRFVNKDLIACDHVNRDGSICVHTPHHIDLKSKIFYDIQALKEWMLKYYIDRQPDQHYEHLIISESARLAKRHCLMFTEIAYQFEKESCGRFKYSYISDGHHQDQDIKNVLVQGFNVGKTYYPCTWSSHYRNLQKFEGIYFFIEAAPVENRRFIVENWHQIESFISQASLKFMSDVRNHASQLFKDPSSEIPVLIGYKVPSGQVHWQCAIIGTHNFPNYAEKISQGNYRGRLQEQSIDWVQTKNCSYEYFFGRGKLDCSLTDKKILLIGTGAVGSIVATTLTRTGCKDLSLVDFDIKEPENVCRSEFRFGTGLTSKIFELQYALIDISPFVSVSCLPKFADDIKIFASDPASHSDLREALNKFDLILDCTADDDLAHLHDLIGVETTIINLAITNHASHLVVVVNPNLHQSKQRILERLDADQADLYNPMGCWSPTFKASYNDISLVVQYAIRHINQTYAAGMAIRNFCVSIDADGLGLKTRQF